MSEVSLEKCLDIVPNRFELAVLVMNRAKEILQGAKSKVEASKYTKKSVKQSLKEIEENDVDLDELKSKIKKNLSIDNVFLKDNNKNFDENIEIDDTDVKTDDDFDDEFDDELEEDIDDENEDITDDMVDNINDDSYEDEK